MPMRVDIFDVLDDTVNTAYKVDSWGFYDMIYDLDFHDRSYKICCVSFIHI